jgi:hypothetical protein
VISGEAARQKYNEFAAVTQRRRAKSPAQKKAEKLKEAIRKFDTRKVELSLQNLADASHQVHAPTHPTGIFDREGGDD